MRLLPIYMMLAAAAAHAADDPAGWTAARWGMSPAEVRAAVPDSATLTGPPADRTIDGKLSTLGVPAVQIGALTWSAYFFFEQDKLTRVELTPADRSLIDTRQFRATESLLAAKYGRPFDRTAEGHSVVQWTFPATLITLTHTDYRPRVQLQTLWLTYAQPTRDKI